GTWEKEGGGVIIDQAIHSVDLVNWLSGRPVKSVGASIANRGHSAVDVEDTAEGLIVYENGAKYAFYCMNNYGCDEPIEIKLFCERGKATLNYDEAVIEYADGRTARAKQEAADVAYEGAKDYWGVQHIRQIEQFYDAVLGKGTLEVTGEEALKTQKLVCDIYASGMKNTAAIRNKLKTD
ncbi:MAG: gfo/Idh/MocA family oxidoreductase, partial [Clostridia bacterium]|nr:gfo/Idh/MocA family oxidoreductase [Clostridia bacterium]